MRKQSGINKIIIVALFGGAILLAYSVVSAAITEQCAYCHTMHNSQDGDVFVGVVGSGGTDTVGPDAPYGSLLRWDCIGCHTGDNDGGTTPYVLTVTDPTAGYTNGDTGAGPTLAGGDFYWVSQNSVAADRRGHNVDPIVVSDRNILTPAQDTPPGWDPTIVADINDGAATWSQQLRCAGTWGCHGNHAEDDSFASISGAHHDQSSGIGADFRFLDGIAGLEDIDWEYTAAVGNHNQYKGYNRVKADADEDAAGGELPTDTISYLCGECHGQFHQGAADLGAVNVDGAWIRHPTDFDLSDASGSEYAGYGGGSAYVTAAPVGSVDVTAVKSTVLVDGTDAIVTCISCHRAHGSPYDDLLRWDYANDCNAGTADAACGCFECHTTKDSP